MQWLIPKCSLKFPGKLLSYQGQLVTASKYSFCQIRPVIEKWINLWDDELNLPFYFAIPMRELKTTVHTFLPCHWSCWSQENVGVVWLSDSLTLSSWWDQTSSYWTSRSMPTSTPLCSIEEGWLKVTWLFSQDQVVSRRDKWHKIVKQHGNWPFSSLCPTKASNIHLH